MKDQSGQDEADIADHDKEEPHQAPRDVTEPHLTESGDKEAQSGGWSIHGSVLGKGVLKSREASAYRFWGAQSYEEMLREVDSFVAQGMELPEAAEIVGLPPGQYYPAERRLIDFIPTPDQIAEGAAEALAKRPPIPDTGEESSSYEHLRLRELMQPPS